MSMLRMLALLGSGASGMAQGERQAKQDAWEAEKQARTKTQWQRDDQQYAQDQADQQAMRTGMAPVNATPDMATMADGTQQPSLAPDPTTDNIDVGQPGTAPGIPTQTVGSQAGLLPAQAAAAAAQLNSPGARMQRAANAVSNPLLAAKLTQDAQQAKLTGIQVDDATRNEAARVFDTGLRQATQQGPDALAKFLSDSQGDGQGGAARFKAIKSPDGKQFSLAQVNPDGSIMGQGKWFDDNESGRAELGFALARGTSDEAKLNHAMADKKFAADRAEKATELGIQQTRADTDKASQERMGTIALKSLAVQERMANAAEARQKKLEGGLFERMDEADKIQYQGLAKQSETLNSAISKAQAEGMWNNDNPGSKQLLERQAALNLQMDGVLKKYSSTAAPNADPLGLGGGKKTPTSTPDPTIRSAPPGGITKTPTGAWVPNGSASAPPPGPMQTTAASQIPDPPPPTRQVGVSLQPNPAYAEWAQQYGEAWKAQQAAAAAQADQAAAAAKATFNPYAQNNVR